MLLLAAPAVAGTCAGLVASMLPAGTTDDTGQPLGGGIGEWYQVAGQCTACATVQVTNANVIEWFAHAPSPPGCTFASGVLTCPCKPEGRVCIYLRTAPPPTAGATTPAHVTFVDASTPVDASPSLGGVAPACALTSGGPGTTTSTTTSTITGSTVTTSTVRSTGRGGPDCQALWLDVATVGAKLLRGDETAVAVAGLNGGTRGTTCRVSLRLRPVGEGAAAEVAPSDAYLVNLEPGGTTQPLFLVKLPLQGAAARYRVRACVADTDRRDLNPRNECLPTSFVQSADVVEPGFIEPLPNPNRPPRALSGPDCEIVWIDVATERRRLLRGDETGVAVMGLNAGTVATTCKVTLAAERLSGGGEAMVTPADGYLIPLAPGASTDSLFHVSLPLHGAAPLYRLFGCVADTDPADLRPGNECFSVEGHAANAVTPTPIEPLPPAGRPPLAAGGPDCAAVRVDVDGKGGRIKRGAPVAVRVSGFNAGTGAAACRVTVTAERLDGGADAVVTPADGYAITLDPGASTQQAFEIDIPRAAAGVYRVKGCVADGDSTDIRPWNECTTVNVRTR